MEPTSHVTHLTRRSHKKPHHSPLPSPHPAAPPIYGTYVPRHASHAPKPQEGASLATPLTSPRSAHPRRWALHPESSRPIPTDPELSRPIQTEMTISVPSISQHQLTSPNISEYHFFFSGLAFRAISSPRLQPDTA